VRERDNPREVFDLGSGHPATVLSARGGSRLWIILLLLVVIALGGGGAYLYYFEPEIADEWLSKTPLKITPPATVTRVYKWRDENGNWQITDHPPHNADYEVQEYRSDRNIVPAIKTEQ